MGSKASESAEAIILQYYLELRSIEPRAICMAKCEVDYSSVAMRRVCETAFVDSIVFLLSV